MNRLFRRSLIYAVCMLIVLYCTVLATAAVSIAENDYSDIKGHWAEKTIKEMISKGWVNGISIDGKIQIQPDKHITRSEFIAVLNRIQEIPKTQGKAVKFSDVNDGAWYKEALDRISGSGLVNGYNDGTFKPDNPIERAEIAAILCRAASWETAENIDKISKLETFNDVAGGKWYYNSVMINKLKGIIYGYPDGNFGPANKATRAEAFTMIARFVKQMDSVVTHPGT